jgi:hypothetical protein
MTLGKSELRCGHFHGSREMKLNFWQILGIVLLIAGLAWYIYNKNHGIPNSTHVPTTTTTTR